MYSINTALPHCGYKIVEKMKLMENYSYSGKLYFVGSADILDFQNFRFDEVRQIIEFDFYCGESNSGWYGWDEGKATQADAQSYTTEHFSPYEYSKKQARLYFEPATFRFLSDDDGKQFLYVKGTWLQGGSKKRTFHGLLECEGLRNAQYYAQQNMNRARNFEYRGDLYFVGSKDVLNVRTFHFQDDLERMRIDFSLQISKSESYSHDVNATKSGGYAYRTEKFELYGEPGSTVQFVFNPDNLLFLVDTAGRRFLYLRGSWHEGHGDPWTMHGLLCA